MTNVEADKLQSCSWVNTVLAMGRKGDWGPGKPRKEALTYQGGIGVQRWELLPDSLKDGAPQPCLGGPGT